jgi:hypothetical protein
LGVLQSYGIHDYLPQDGVGAFGLIVTCESITWQPYLFYFVDEPGSNIWPGIATCVRGQALIINSTITNEPKVLMVDVTGEKDLESWKQTWESFAYSFIKAKQFDFIVLLGTEPRKRVVIVIEMKREYESKMVKISPGSDSNGIDWLQIHGQVISDLRQDFASPQQDTIDFRFGFIRFEPCSQAETEALFLTGIDGDLR